MIAINSVMTASLNKERRKNWSRGKEEELDQREEDDVQEENASCDELLEVEENRKSEDEETA